MILLSRMPEFLKTADIKDLIKKAYPCDWFNYRSVSLVFYLQGTREDCCSATEPTPAQEQHMWDVPLRL